MASNQTVDTQSPALQVILHIVCGSVSCPVQPHMHNLEDYTGYYNCAVWLVEPATLHAVQILDEVHRLVNMQ